MTQRLPVLKTYKLFIDGAFPRSESGRSMVIESNGDTPTIAHLCKASRKDLRDAVEAARRAHEKWAAASSYNRGQVMYRMAEMMEGKRLELEHAIASVAGPKSAASLNKARATSKGSVKSTSKVTGTSRLAKAVLSPEQEVSLSIDRIIYYAGWADKYAQILGCNNPVTGPYYNFTITEPSGVIGCITPDQHPLLALVSLLAPVIVSGNAAIALASQINPIPSAIFAEVCATSDVPAGVINILTGERGELLKFFATHREIDGLHAANLSTEESSLLREGMAENLKRICIHTKVDFAHTLPGNANCNSPYWIEPFIEPKTIWHPASV